ncbi:hypothetical protein [Lactobacillus kefiranofaciens]|nr:hypothetical protein [Lactobacillus kefiranofaciens]AEG41723.1 hypothetical protein WANG_p1120 [Lactobacillus kefiranofaciens subsp. kefiranofaciens]QFQ68355.1 hypothetical protein LKK75_08200 [Lactobacillus kefiranofaciens subsp. kefiranofaciens]WQH36826.1 hypothetical protein U2870_04235 [Lactobacillus kefiranofaciens]SDA63375.1 hypothetical protein SAMN02983011_01819 [Lactobacillus kefiranofaciens]
MKKFIKKGKELRTIKTVFLILFFGFIVAEFIISVAILNSKTKGIQASNEEQPEITHVVRSQNLALHGFAYKLIPKSGARFYLAKSHLAKSAQVHDTLYVPVEYQGSSFNLSDQINFNTLSVTLPNSKEYLHVAKIYSIKSKKNDTSTQIFGKCDKKGYLKLSEFKLEKATKMNLSKKANSNQLFLALPEQKNLD